MEITVAKKLEFMMMAFVIMASHLRCATVHVDCGNVSPSLIDIGEQEEKMYSERNFTICDMYDLIDKAYPGAFETEEAAKQRTGLEFSAYVDQTHQGSLPTNVKNDADRCCQTWHFFTWNPVKLDDVNNETCYIINRPDVHQYYDTGHCLGKGNCTNCVQQYKIHAMVAWCPASWGIKNHNFKVRSYCSCQEIP